MPPVVEPPAAETLQPPTNLTATAAITSIQVLWDASLTPDVTGYALYKRIGAFETRVGTVQGSASSYTFQSLAAETTHHLSVASLRGEEESVERATITVDTLAAAVLQSTIRFRHLEFNAIEDSVVEVIVDRAGGDNTAIEIVDVTETTGTSGTGTTVPTPPVNGVDYTIAWPGGVSEEVKFLANETEAIITFTALADAVVEFGEHVSFGIQPEPTEAYIVEQAASTSVVNIIDATTAPYADSVITFTAMENNPITYIRVVVEIDPAHPANLPVFELVGSTTTVPDVYENTRIHNDLVDSVVVVGKVEHAAFTGDDVYGQTVILRDNSAATKLGADQFVNVVLTGLRYEMRGVPTHATIEMNPFVTALDARAGDWGKETLWWGYVQAPASTERIGVKTALTWVGDVDMVMIEVMLDNTLYDPTNGSQYVAHNEVAGDVYFDALGIKTSTIPSGWSVEHLHHNETSMVGDDFIVDETGLQVVPAKHRSNIKRFYLRKTATSTQLRAQSKFAGAGLGKVTSGGLKSGTRFGSMGLGIPAGIWPDSDAIRVDMEAEWQDMLLRIQTGVETPAPLWGSARWGHYHSGGTRQYSEEGDDYMFGCIGFSNTTAELNLIRHCFYMSQGRACTGLNSPTNGAVITADDLATNNSDQSPFVTALDGSDFETWFWHMRPDSNTTHGTGAINPNITEHTSGNHSKSLLPLTNPWSIPGATAVISDVAQFAMQRNTGEYNSVTGDPPNGTQHRRHTIFLEGMVKMTGCIFARWLAGEEASHVMRSLTRHPVHASGTTADWTHHDLEWPIVAGKADIDTHADGRPFFGGRGGGGGTNPAHIHSLAGQAQETVALGMACSVLRARRSEMRSWTGAYIGLADLRSSPLGWGSRAHSLVNEVTSPHNTDHWATPDLINQRGGWPTWMIGTPSSWQSLVASGAAALERRVRPRDSYPSGTDLPHARMVIDTFMEQVDRANHWDRKVLPAYGIVMGSAEQTGLASALEAVPDGLLGTVGTGNNTPNWLEELRRPSDGGYATLAKATMRDESLHWAMAVASFLEQNPTITHVPIIDIVRDILEGLSEEDDGAFKSLTYAEAALVCTEGYSHTGGREDLIDFYPAQHVRQRRWMALGLMQNADALLLKFPYWGAGDKTNLLAAPTGLIGTDSPVGVDLIWDAVPGATSYRVEWMELLPNEGGIDGSFETSDTTALVSTNLPPDTYNVYIRVMAINVLGERCTSSGLLAVVIGSGTLNNILTQSGELSGFNLPPKTPSMVSATGLEGSIEIEFTLPTSGVQPIQVLADYDTDSAFPAGTSVQEFLANIEDPINGVYKMVIPSLAVATYYVAVRSRSAAGVFSDRSTPLTALVLTVTTPGTSGDAPVGLSVSPTAIDATLAWLASGSVTGTYFAGYGSRRDTIDNLSETTATNMTISSVPTAVRFYSVQHKNTDGTRSALAEPGWSYNSSVGHIGWVNSNVRPIERPQGVTADVSLGHVGCRIDTVDLAPPPAHWISGGEYVLPYWDPTGYYASSPALITGYRFDRPVRIAGSELSVQSFRDCEFEAYGPLPQDKANYCIYVKAGDSALVNLRDCTIRYGKKALYFRGGAIQDCAFVDNGEDGIHIDWLVHDFGLFHCAFPGIGNVASQGLIWHVATTVAPDLTDAYYDYGTTVFDSTGGGNSKDPHGDGVQIRCGNNGGSSSNKAINIFGCDIPVLWWDDPAMPGTHTIISMSSGIFLETADGPITGFMIRDNWVGSAANSIQLVDDNIPPVGYGPPEGDLLNNIIVVAGTTPSNPIDSDVVNGINAANSDTDGNNL